jgi:hypothetical protein
MSKGKAERGMAASVSRQATDPVSVDQFRTKKESDTLDSLRGLLTRTLASISKICDVQNRLSPQNSSVSHLGFSPRKTTKGMDLIAEFTAAQHAVVAETQKPR